MVEAILALRREHPTWGSRKLLIRLQKLHPKPVWPAASTIHNILQKAGLTTRARRKKVVPFKAALAEATRPNSVWCMDFKGSFDCINGERCDTFTVTDAFSRFILYCQAIPNLNHHEVDRICDVLMRKYGLPEHIRTDNGTPFCSISGLGISKLSIKWQQLGIVHERIDPGKPQQNGQHERMHRTVKEDTASPPATTLAMQRLRFEEFKKSFNNERSAPSYRHEDAAVAVLVEQARISAQASRDHLRGALRLETDSRQLNSPLERERNIYQPGPNGA